MSDERQDDVTEPDATPEGGLPSRTPSPGSVRAQRQVPIAVP